MAGMARAERDLRSDTWVAVDGLGRRVSHYAETGPPREDRTVGIFYFTWHGQHSSAGPYDITHILAAHPDNPQWGPVHTFHHWGESELGYYISTDPYVIRKHCRDLVDAGVDMLIFDVTNAFTYTNVYMAILGHYQQIRAAGGRTPQVCFIANSSAAQTVTTLYNDLYSKNLYPELWFRWQGKPLILAAPDGLSSEIQSFFTFRKTWYSSSSSGWFGDGRDKWTWLDPYPQNPGWHTPGVPEEISVGVATHPTSNIGRSWHDGHQPDREDWQTAKGLFFDRQWQRALEVDPQFVFVTGWNEWVAQRFLSNGSQSFLGETLPAGETFFVDAYTQEFSRDIEPMKGGHGDAYYYQMIDNIRRYKGVRKPPAPSGPKTITLDGQFADWADVQPEYLDNRGDTYPRNYPGWGAAGTYTNTSGRNDIVRCKVARDEENVYFYVETEDTMSSFTDNAWMWLFIDTDSDPDTGWQGYDYVINDPTITNALTSVKRNTGGWNWTSAGDAQYRKGGQALELAVPRSVLGLDNTTDLSLQFHWADNIRQPGNIDEFSVSGDSAPNRRFAYRYSTDTAPPAAVGNLRATTYQSIVTLSWSLPDDPDRTGIVIRCSTEAPPASIEDGQAVALLPPDATHYTHNNISDYCTVRHYAVFTYDLDSNVAAAGVSARPLPETAPDSDDDDIPDLCDNCPLDANPDQADGDHDGMGDMCDICPGHVDSIDTDYDEVPDGCDVCLGGDDQAHSDNDGHPDHCDNCPLTDNLEQVDRDGDGYGDMCDECPDDPYKFAVGQCGCGQPETDSDDDSVADCVDLCSETKPGTYVTLDGCPTCRADLDRDGDVDLSDFGHLQACYTGSYIPQYRPDCQNAKLDSDNDIDQADLNRFAVCITGDDIPADPACLP